MHTVCVSFGTQTIERVTRPTFKAAWRAARRRVRARAHADGVAGEVYERPRGRVRLTVGAFAAVPERRGVAL